MRQTRFTTMERLTWVGVLLVLSAAGCTKPRLPELERHLIDPVPRASIRPSNDELITEHNSRVSAISHVWARAGFEVEWLEDGHKQWESGDGHMLMKLPQQVLIAFGKMGHANIYIGHNKSVLFVIVREGKRRGAYASLGDSQPPDNTLLSLFRPLEAGDIPRAMGLAPMSYAKANDNPEVTSRFRGARAVVQIDEEIRWVTYFSNATFLPARVEAYIVHGSRSPVLVVSLQEYAAMKLRDGSSGPLVPTKVRLRFGDVTLDVDASDVRDTTATGDTIRDNVFLFDTLRRQAGIAGSEVYVYE